MRLRLRLLVARFTHTNEPQGGPPISSPPTRSRRTICKATRKPVLSQSRLDWRAELPNKFLWFQYAHEIWWVLMEIALLQLLLVYMHWCSHCDWFSKMTGEMTGAFLYVGDKRYLDGISSHMPFVFVNANQLVWTIQWDWTQYNYSTRIAMIGQPPNR